MQSVAARARRVLSYLRGSRDAQNVFFFKPNKRQKVNQSDVWQVKVTKIMSGWMRRKSWAEGRVTVGYKWREIHQANGFLLQLNVLRRLQLAALLREDRADST